MLESGHSIEGKKPDREAALQSLREHRRAIEYGLFRPESVNLPPIYEQNVVDTCHVGWIPLAFKRGVMKWITLVTDNTTLTGEGLAYYRQRVLSILKVLCEQEPGSLQRRERQEESRLLPVCPNCGSQGLQES